jgi:ribonuclease HII
MSFLLGGVDEAGLGPLLGPLCLGWALFEVPDPESDPRALLSDVVAEDPKRDKEHFVVADSKRVYSRNARGRKRLEATALAFHAATHGFRLESDPLRYLQGELGPSERWLSHHPWYRSLPTPLPTFWERGALELRLERLRRALEASGVSLPTAGARPVPVAELNACFEETGNKSTALWRYTGAAVAHLLERCRGRQGRLVVDRQGGRSQYGGHLARLAPDWSVALVEEGPGASRYRLTERGGAGDVAVDFLEKGEQHSLATALASCLAKYARELAMEGFNAYFAERQPDLAPTAGYTTDGRRWLVDAGETLKAAGLSRRCVIRER